MVFTAAMLLISTRKIIAQPLDDSITQNSVIAQQAPAVALTPQQLIEQEFEDAPIMIKIAGAEDTTFNPSAKNPTSSAKGLFQIVDGTWKSYNCTGSPYNAKDNIECARKIYSDVGTTPWNASKARWS